MGQLLWEISEWNREEHQGSLKTYSLCEKLEKSVDLQLMLILSRIGQEYKADIQYTFLGKDVRVNLDFDHNKYTSLMLEETYNHVEKKWERLWNPDNKRTFP